MLKRLLLPILLILLSFAAGWLSQQFFSSQKNQGLLNPFVTPEPQEPEKPLLELTIPELRERTYIPSTIEVLEELETTESYTAYLFQYTTLGKTMTGQLNVPTEVKTENPPVMVLLRGYVPPASYQTGVGTKSAAEVFAENGYLTLAPDFFGYGGSDPEPEDSWQSRFEKPISVIELIKSIQTIGIPLHSTTSATFTTSTIGIWAHSNGGQIALTTLEVLSEPIPTTLWAPVTAPFPYSVLFFSDEAEDEGKSSRLWISQFEKLYDVFDFSLSQHLHYLTGPLQIHQGMIDDAVPYSWSDEFVAKITTENSRREAVTAEQETLATMAAETESETTVLLDKIEMSYYRYPGTDHNMRPSWNTAIQRDLEFFSSELPQL